MYTRLSIPSNFPNQQGEFTETMETDNAVTLLRALKGAPLSVLIAIRLFPGPANLLQLSAATGYERTAIAQAVDTLELMGFVERAHYRGWRLSGLAQQLPLWTPSEIGEGDDTPRLASRPAGLLSAGKNRTQRDGRAGGASLKAGKTRFQREIAQDADEDEILRAGKTSFQQEPAPDAAGTETLKAGKTRFQQDALPGAAHPAGTTCAPKAGKNRFQQETATDAGEATFPKAGKTRFQGDAPADAAEPASTAPDLKAGKNHFQPEPAGDDGQPQTVKAGKTRFQTPVARPSRLKAGKTRFRRGVVVQRLARERGGGCLNNPLTTRVKPPQPPRARGTTPAAGETPAVNRSPGVRARGVATGSRPARRTDLLPPLDADAVAVVDDLVDLVACPRHRAEEAVRTARAAGHPAAWLHLNVLRWHAYVTSDRARSICNPGYFVARKLEGNEPCPTVTVADEHAADAHALERTLGLHRSAGLSQGYTVPAGYEGLIKH